MRISRFELKQIIFEELQIIAEGWSKGWLGGKKKSNKIEDSEEKSKKTRKKAEKSLKKVQSLTDRFEKEFGDLNEVVTGQLSERYIALIYKWLQVKSKQSPHNLNKLVNFLQRSENDVTMKYLLRMAKEVRFHKDTIDASWPSKKEFVLSDQWQEVPKDTIMPPGAEYRMDLAAEKTYAKLRK